MAHLGYAATLDGAAAIPGAFATAKHSSIMRTIEGSLTNAVKRFDNCTCDLAETRAPRPDREATRGPGDLKSLSPSLTGKP